MNLLGDVPLGVTAVAHYRQRVDTMDQLTVKGKRKAQIYAKP
jgi:hypothetical protein